MMSMAHEYHARAKTAVFWDMEGCKIPDGVNAVEVSQKIRAALEKLNYRGTTTIYAYGDTKKMEADLESKGYVVKQHTPTANMDEDYRGTASIYASGDTNQTPEIVFNHIAEDMRLDRILRGFLCWALDNTAPANLLLILGSISGHMEFVYACNHVGSAGGYKILVAQPQDKTEPLLPREPAKWFWESLSLGGDPIPPRTLSKPAPGGW